MVVDYFLDMEDAYGHMWLRAWRCVNCGEVVEPGITSHRLAQVSRVARWIERLTGRGHARRGEVIPLST
jgi:hypothetical protein